MTYQATIRIDRPPLDMDYEAWTPHAPLVWCWQLKEEYAPLGRKDMTDPGKGKGNDPGKGKDMTDPGKGKDNDKGKGKDNDKGKGKGTVRDRGDQAHRPTLVRTRPTLAMDPWVVARRYQLLLEDVVLSERPWDHRTDSFL